MSLSPKTDRTAAAVAEATATASAAPVTYQIDPAHSAAGFRVRHLMISNVKGEFTKVNGTITYDPSNLAASKVSVTIDANSIETREPQRDAHLKSPDFFDTEKYPTLTFESTSLSREDGGLRVAGKLTMHGVTQDVVLDVTDLAPEMKDPWGYLRIGASATAKINRKDWGLVWNQALETGGVMVGEAVTISLDIEAGRPAADK